MIDMDTKPGRSFFDIIGCEYDNYRADDLLQMEKLRDYYRGKDSSSRMWWMPPGKESLANIEEEAVPMETIFWSSLSPEEKAGIRIESMARFPSIFGRGELKYEEIAFYLIKEKNIINKSIRDLFSASGTGHRIFLEQTYKRIPRIFLHLWDNAKEVLSFILRQGYNESVGSEAFSLWMEVFQTEAKDTLDNTNNCSLTIKVLKDYLNTVKDELLDDQRASSQER